MQDTLKNLTRRLMDLRGDSGHWTGELASSALSTATAVSALAGSGREALVRGGLHWLAENRNPDGGWGDTTLSASNISTTALCWSAFAIGRAESGEYAPVSSAAAAWLKRAAGSLEPDRLAESIAARYGKDRTFSVPILTTLALAGRLGSGEQAWRRVPPLPFELAAFPRRWFRWLRLPVVSYALPALVALGQARHHALPTENPVLRPVRNWTRNRTLRVLRSIQPASGGFLEAVPLTSFVLLSLTAAGNARHRAAIDASEFLKAAVRPDGSWPIDSNLATWVTTLAVNALALLPDFSRILPPEDQQKIRDWLLSQQYRCVHPYTGADPGGWAWTDLPGGVPDADDTAGALLALKNLGPCDGRVRQAAIAGITWLLNLQNRDGGMPTFCRGWGLLPFDRSSPDLTAHALAAWNAWSALAPPNLQKRLVAATGRALDYLKRVQRKDGAFVPLWFGNQFVKGDENPTYGTARVLWALRENRAAHGWLLAAQNSDGGWGGGPGSPSSVEETGLALGAFAGGNERGAAWLIEHTANGTDVRPSPIGLYFAKLWYYEKLYPLIFAISGLASCDVKTAAAN